MKKTVIVTIALIAFFSTTTAQQKQSSVAISFTQNLVEFFAQPTSAKAPSLPMVQAKAKNGDLFGVNFRGVSGIAPFIELLDADGKRVQLITVNDFLGKSTDKGIKLISSKVAGTGNRSENVYEVSNTQGKFLLIASSVATAGKSTKDTPAKLLVRLALKNQPSNIASAKITLPVDGTAETKNGGFTIVGKKSTQPLFATVFPKTEKISIVKNNITISTIPVKSSDETVVLFLTIDCANTKEEATATLLAYDQKSNINVSIVTVSNKATAQPTDTLLYQIICTNVGNGAAQDIIISNPVSASTRYVEESASGSETEITFDRTPATAPALGAVKNIKWKLLKMLDVGEEKIVSFKVIVQ